PALFLGHGSPMNVLEDNRYTRAWAQLGETLPRPKAIVVVSAQSSLDAMEAGYSVGTRTIVDVLDATTTLYNAKQQLSNA
ncbi:TolC family protein, partial [Klebsiella pneumoniae]|uniref:TolC family protein n=1 Tax=Klebsiella pneumoniae TaxID=573 RepID=UPI00214C9367